MVPDSTLAVVISAPQSPPQAEWFYWILTLVGSVSWSFIIVPAIKIPRAKLNIHQEAMGRTYWREGHGGAVRCWGDESLPRDRERGKPRQMEALVRTLWALRDKKPNLKHSEEQRDDIGFPAGKGEDALHSWTWKLDCQMSQGSSGHLPIPTPLSLPLAVVIQTQMSRSPQTLGLLCSYSANPKERDAPNITNEAWVP